MATVSLKSNQSTLKYLIVPETHQTYTIMAYIHLQGIGEKPAVQAGTLKVGDVLIWNYGYTSTITGIVKETAKTIVFQTKSDETGRLYEQRFTKSRLVVKKQEQ